MEASRSNCILSSHCLWIGLTIGNFALFLHPMNPEDFLIMVGSHPLQTVNGEHGSEMALLFWTGLALTVFGLLGLVRAQGIFQSRKRPLLRHANRHT
jgi:hypothetical protein